MAEVHRLQGLASATLIDNVFVFLFLVVVHIFLFFGLYFYLVVGVPRFCWGLHPSPVALNILKLSKLLQQLQRSFSKKINLNLIFKSF